MGCKVVELVSRFRKPEPVEPWEGVLDGTRMPNTCVQVSTREIMVYW
jgi:carboxylesterase type B